MSVLLAIKPKYVREIENGSKKYEFRKVIFKNTDITKVYIYSSSPVKKIIGYFEIEQILQEKPSDLWNKVKKYSGIKEEEFFSYFEGKNIGFAIKISKMKSLDNPIDPKEIDKNFKPPQSFYYFNDTELLNHIEATK